MTGSKSKSRSTAGATSSSSPNGRMVAVVVALLAATLFWAGSAPSKQSQHQRNVNDNGELELGADNTFRCGDRVVSWEGTPTQPRTVLRVVPATTGAAALGKSIPVSHVEDDYCDCPDGSDEVGTGACATTGYPTAFTTQADILSLMQQQQQQKQRQHDGGDAAAVPHDTTSSRRISSVVPAPLVASSSSSSRGGGAKSDMASSPPPRGSTIVRPQRFAEGYKEYQRRARHGSSVFGPEFTANVTKDSEEFTEWSSQFQAYMADLQTRIQNVRAYQAEVAVAKASGSPQEALPPPPAAVAQAEMSRAQQLRRYAGQKQGELQAKNALLQSHAFGKYFEYYPLFGVCYNYTIHEKPLKGGSAIPEQHFVVFRVCPFISVQQRTETPDVQAALERLSAGQSPSADEGDDHSLQEHQKSICTTDPESDACSELTELHHQRAQRAKDTDTVRHLVVGYWSGYLANTFDNITAIDVLERFRLQRAPEAVSTSSFLIHQYTHGEPCWNGPPRTAAFVFECDTEDRVLKIVENGMCRYEILFGTPSACSDDVLIAYQQQVRGAKKK